MNPVKKVLAIIGGLLVAYFAFVGGFYVAGYRLYRIPTGSMRPTIMKGDRAIGRLSDSYRTRVQRFDLAIYRIPQSPGEIYVKRVIGLSGERVTVGDRSVLIDGRELELPAAMDRGGLGKKKCDLLVPADAVFILGDYTADSLDSRYFGAISKADLIGYMVFRR